MAISTGSLSVGIPYYIYFFPLVLKLRAHALVAVMYDKIINNNECVVNTGEIAIL